MLICVKFSINVFIFTMPTFLRKPNNLSTSPNGCKHVPCPITSSSISLSQIPVPVCRRVLILFLELFLLLVQTHGKAYVFPEFLESFTPDFSSQKRNLFILPQWSFSHSITYNQLPLLLPPLPYYFLPLSDFCSNSETQLILST